MTSATMETATIPKGFDLERLRSLLTAPNVVLRHDVDYVPECALEMARLEYELSVTSTYYVRPDGDYNVSKLETLELFQEIVRLGHDVAPHVDLMLDRAATTPAEYVRLCTERDFIYLSTLLPVVRRVSFHAPPRAICWAEVSGFDHALSPSWFNRYVADSRGIFRTNPEERLAVGDVVQLNLHPEWWFLSETRADFLRMEEAIRP